MWSHYANGHHGVAIGVEVDKARYDIREVKYLENLPSIQDTNVNRYFLTTTAKSILSNKLKLWSYEDEVRIFTYNSEYVEVTIKEIILGSRMEEDNKNLIRELVEKIDNTIAIRNSEVEMFR